MIDQSVIDKLEFPKVLDLISRYAITESGRNKVLNLLPVNNPDYIKNEGELVNEAKELINTVGYPPIEYLSEIFTVISETRIDGAVISGIKLLEILKLAKTSRLLRQFIFQESKEDSLLKQKASGLFADKLFENRIEKIITEQGEIKENASTELARLRKEINNKKSELVKSINRIIKSLKEEDIVREDYLTLRDGRMVIPVKVEHKRHLRGFIHSESSTGQTVYIEPEETLDLNNDIISTSFAEKREIERILKELTKVIGQSAGQLKVSLEALAEIDSIFARAKYSLEIIGEFPGIENSKPLYLSEARHPLLLKKLGRQNTVPLSFELNDINVVVITGPNAGGKTVVLKTIGLLNLMLQAGIHVPVNSESNFHIFDNILIDIGDQQSIEDDLSTFSSHLKNLTHIINSSDSKTLILLDEIGTGTEPAEGSALAASILDELQKKGSLVFATTHHGSLKVFAFNQKRMQNAAMEFDHSNLFPTYRFHLGIPGSSYAFEIAKRSGISESILDNAKKNIDDDKYSLERFLSELEEKSNKLNKKLNELEIENTRLKGLSALYKKSYEKIENEKKEILKKVKVESDLYLDNVNKQIEKVIKEIREKEASKEVIREAKKIIQDVKEENKNAFNFLNDKTNDNRQYKVGDTVAIKNSSTVGKIVEINKEKAQATILVGSIKMKVKLSELIEAAESKSVQKEKFNNFPITEIDYRLDIRGERPEEAEYKVIRFIDEAYQASLDRVEILHGKGTGALKKTVWDILKHHDKIKNYYFAAIEFGGDGITIVELI
ncbi:MAG: endonuclease MutS2 [Ignavibacteriota bacterium]|nr:endonuclease MutS2 [Ignavibacteriota bacterium]MCO6447917.1 endonuclease MutS2 [Ignavibacterium album]QKJ99113.1 MAG: endonuclease MutS2 [Ignavibacteriota bacterium]HOJ07069.1 endonuclease MutS2 [Ignavibacteriaceae bacterium]